MSIRTRFLRVIGAGADGDRGVALPAVIGLGLVMLIMVAGSLSAVTGGVLKTNTDEDLKGAVAAAYAGVSEYQSRLSNDATYYKFGNPAAAFSTSSAAALSLPGGQNTNPAFGDGPSGSWANIPDPVTGANSGASFRYQVDSSRYATQGIIRLQSTGRVGSVTATLVADLRQKGFIDFLYFTDFETGDPILNAATKSLLDSNNNNQCARYAWASTTRPDICGNITFGSFDDLQGPVHSNDTLDVCGAKFEGVVTTGDPSSQSGGKNYESDSGCDDSDSLWLKGRPTSVGTLPMPLTNSSMPTETQPDVPATVPNPGCMYTGPTQITFFVDTNGVGKMRVISPWTKHTEPTSTGDAGPDPDKCGKISDLHSTTGAVVDVLDLNLLFVQTVPGSSSNPNYSSSTPSGMTCLNSTQYEPVPDPNNSRRTIRTPINGSGFKFGSVQYPSSTELLPISSTSDNPAYSCRNGDLYLSGTLKGRTTVATDNYIYLTGDTTYSDPSSDILGAVAQNGVWVWNPITCSSSLYSNSSGYTSCSGSWGYGNSDANPTVNAAILSVAHTFIAQNYDGGTPDLGARGTLTVSGAIAQRFRGPVATGGFDRSGNYSISSGFRKAYVYDPRFRNTAPPKFLTPITTTYGVTQYAGVAAAYDSKGNRT